MELKKLIKEQKYEEIYQKYGKEIYCLFTPIGYKHDDIVNLLKQQKYEEIEKKYTKLDCITVKDFRVYNSDKFKKIKKMKKEGKFFELSEAYFINREILAMGRDVYLETGSKFKVVRYETELIAKELLKGTSKFGLVFGVVTFLCVGVGAPMIKYDMYHESENTFKSAIEESDQSINKYVLELREGNYTDLEVIVKVNNDILSGMKGYKAPLFDIPYFNRAVLLDDDSVGVCRHIADKYTKILNRYNKDWEAYNITVYMDKSKYKKKDAINNIELNVISHPSNPQSESQNQNNKSINANHMVTLLKTPDLKYPLIIDATNPSIGILVEGKIVMLSTIDGEGLSYRIVDQYVNTTDDDYLNANVEFLKSLFVPYNEDDLKEMIESFGVDAQNEALNSILSKDLESGKSLKP